MIYICVFTTAPAVPVWIYGLKTVPFAKYPNPMHWIAGKFPFQLYACVMPIVVLPATSWNWASKVPVSPVNVHIAIYQPSLGAVQVAPPVPALQVLVVYAVFPFCVKTGSNLFFISVSVKYLSSWEWLDGVKLLGFPVTSAHGNFVGIFPSRLLNLVVTSLSVKYLSSWVWLAGVKLLGFPVTSAHGNFVGIFASRSLISSFL